MLSFDCLTLGKKNYLMERTQLFLFIVERIDSDGQDDMCSNLMKRRLLLACPWACLVEMSSSTEAIDRADSD